jgi:hypothetical protein
LRNERAATPKDGRSGEHLAGRLPSDVRVDEAVALSEGLAKLAIGEVARDGRSVGQSVGEGSIDDCCIDVGVWLRSTESPQVTQAINKVGGAGISRDA